MMYCNIWTTRPPGKCWKALHQPEVICTRLGRPLSIHSVIWNPYKEKYNEQIEKVQRRATKTLPKLNKLEYIDRLKKLKLPCLKYRRTKEVKRRLD